MCSFTSVNDDDYCYYNLQIAIQFYNLDSLQLLLNKTVEKYEKLLLYIQTQKWELGNFQVNIRQFLYEKLLFVIIIIIIIIIQHQNRNLI